MLLLALATTGGASAGPPAGSCPPKDAKNPFELYPVSAFPGVEFIDLNGNGFVCVFQLPFPAFQVIDDVAQAP